MKRQWVRCLALLCALALLTGFLSTVPARADEITVYQLALNDRLKPISSEFTPIFSGGAYYIPYTVFDKNVTEVDLGISYGQTKGDGVHTLTIYSLSTMLVFDVLAGTCVTNKGESVELKAIARNGRVYVPLNSYRYFSDLSSSFTPTSYGTLIRITNGQQSLSTGRFVDVAASMMRGQYNKYLESLNVTPPVASPSPSPGVTPLPTPPGGGDDPTRPQAQVYLAFRCEGGGGLEDILTRLEQTGVRALFLLTPEALTENGDQVRRMVGGGHAVGLLVTATGEQALAEELEAGNALLARVARLRTHTVLAEGAGAGALEALRAAGWRPWLDNVDGLPGGRSQAAQTRGILDGVAAKRGAAWVTMNDSTQSAGALSRVLAQLRAEGYGIRLAVETALG